MNCFRFSALRRALKIGHRSGRWRFDWDTPEQVYAKVQEELAEVRAAIASGDARHTEEEMGDLLFAVSQWARRLGIDPEEALHKANHKFEIRFRKMISECGLDRERFSALPLDEKERLWQEAKRKLAPWPGKSAKT